ncbi:MAG: anion permease [Deltaproteobacteria bacterium]|nr:anion permease [Deltaproteobacteria bacterium]
MLRTSWRKIVPVLVPTVLAIIPAPTGLPQHAWWYFAIFVGVIVGLVLEPLPGGAVGFIGVTLIGVLARVVLFSPAQLADPAFRATAEAVRFTVSGFANTTVWLIFTAFIVATGYEKTGLGRRVALLLVKAMGRRTLTLGYAVALADLALAPFTPSNTARSGGTLFPVLKSLAALYESKPNDPSARRIGGYLMWTAIAATTVTSSMFATAMAPNLLALEMAQKTVNVTVTWLEWLTAITPVALLLFLATPLLAYLLYPPEVKTGGAVPQWAGQELERMGPLSGRERTLGGLVLTALALWIFAGDLVDATAVAMVVVALMVVTGVVGWDDVLGNRRAWNTLVWFATLVALADGLTRVGFIKWFAETVGGALRGLAPMTATVATVLVFFLLHYLFASVTAHVTALMPVMLVVSTAIPGVDPATVTLSLVATLGIMGVLTPYATGPSPIYFGSGYIRASDYWRLGAIFGAIYIVVLTCVGIPWIVMTR